MGAAKVTLAVKNPPGNTGDTRDMGSIPGSGRSPGGGHGNPLQWSCLENPMDGGAWWATVYGVTQSRTQLKWLSSILIKCQRKFQKKRKHLTSIWPIKRCYLPEKKQVPGPPLRPKLRFHSWCLAMWKPEVENGLCSFWSTVSPPIPFL